LVTAGSLRLHVFVGQDPHGSPLVVASDGSGCRSVAVSSWLSVYSAGHQWIISRQCHLSNPLKTNEKLKHQRSERIFLNFNPVAWGARGSEFESRRPDHYESTG
jgi:hypothetical protein